MIRTGRILRWLLLAILTLGGAAALAAAAFVAYCATTLPRSPTVTTPASPGAIFFAADTGKPLAVRGRYRGEAITADRLPPLLAKAVVAIEDRRFYRHPGVDLRGLLRALQHDLTGEEPTEGGSTITMQLARLTYLTPERSLRRKIQEMLLALWLERRFSKNEILARYLNAVYFGAGAVGADAAARRYFGNRASALDLAQAAMLAGLIRAPSQLSPRRNLAAARQRAGLVLDAMVTDGAISPADAAAARQEKVRLAAPPQSQPGDNYFLDAAEGEVRRLIGTPPLDLSVQTTFDPRLQDAAEQSVQNWLAGEGARRHVGQAALVAMAPDGAILAMVGGRDYRQSQFNRATQAHRQPGSLFKMFVYLAALADGYRPDSVVIDRPVEIGGWQPKNYDDRYRGPVTLRQAFAQSINSVAAQLAQSVGIDRVIATAKSLGVQSPLPDVPSLALGSADVTLLDMTGAMAAIATDRSAIAPHMVRAIRSGQTKLYSRPETVPPRPVWQAAWAPMMHLLEAVVTDGTGRAAQVAGYRSAGKTGTTDDYRDAWFVGFTTDLVVGVWAGNDDDSPMDHVVGGDVPARIWHDFVAQAEQVLARPAAAPPAVGSSRPRPAGPPLPATSAAEPGSLTPPAEPMPSTPGELRGVPFVVDSGTLLINGAPVHLAGIEGQTGRPALQLYRYIDGRDVACVSASAGAALFRCRVGDYDLAEAVLLNGAGRATADAPARLQRAEQQARRAGRGIWAR